VIDFFNRERAGRSATRKYKAVERRWRRRVLGRRTEFYAVVILALLLLLLLTLPLSSTAAMLAGAVWGMAAMGAWLLPDTMIPGHIFSWQLGAWGEENTAGELKQLARRGWLVRHDLRWGKRGNHDHVVAGPAIYLLNSKNVKDSKVTIEADGVRLQRLDDPADGYIADSWAPRAAREARSLKAELDRRLTFPVHVYPVVVLWGGFEAEQQYVGDVMFVRGDRLVDWIASRSADLLTEEKRTRVAEAISGLPRA
jgi:hypothetical protein